MGPTTLQVVDQIPREGVEAVEEGDAHGLALGLNKSTMSQPIHTDEGAQPVAAYSQATQAGEAVETAGIMIEEFGLTRVSETVGAKAI